MRVTLINLVIASLLAASPAHGSDAFNNFGFRSSASSDLFRARGDYRAMFNRPTDFAYEGQWNSQQNTTGSGCATSLANNISVQTQGAGNTVLVLNSQSNDGVISAGCSVGMN